MHCCVYQTILIVVLGLLPSKESSTTLMVLWYQYKAEGMDSIETGRPTLFVSIGKPIWSSPHRYWESTAAIYWMM